MRDDLNEWRDIILFIGWKFGHNKDVNYLQIGLQVNIILMNIPAEVFMDVYSKF